MNNPKKIIDFDWNGESLGLSIQREHQSCAHYTYIWKKNEDLGLTLRLDNASKHIIVSKSTRKDTYIQRGYMLTHYNDQAVKSLPFDQVISNLQYLHQHSQESIVLSFTEPLLPVRVRRLGSKLKKHGIHVGDELHSINGVYIGCLTMEELGKAFKFTSKPCILSFVSNSSKPLNKSSSSSSNSDDENVDLAGRTAAAAIICSLLL